MSDSWSQASGVFQLYSDALAGLGQHLTEPVWQSLMAELRGCQGKSSSLASVHRALRRVKSHICSPAWNVRRFTSTRRMRRMAISVFYAPTTWSLCYRAGKFG